MAEIFLFYNFCGDSSIPNGNITIDSKSIIKDLLLEIFKKAGKKDDVNKILDLDNLYEIRAGKKLLNNKDLNKTVKEINLSNNDEVVVFCRKLLGGFGGLKIVDISKNKVKYLGFSESAPKYRYVINGLNIKSICKNPSCEANNKVIFIQKGFVDKWDLIQNLNDIKCPICGKRVVPKNFGFTRCKYIINFTKVENDEYIDDKVENEVTGDKFQLFDENESGKAEFISLTFTVKRL